MAQSARICVASVLAFTPLVCPLAGAAEASPNAQPSALAITIPRVDRAPTLEDFLDMGPNNGLEGKLAKVEHFVQREPKDGQPATQPTEVYIGYNDKNLYVIFVAFDSEPDKVRARLARRESINDDDQVEVMLDTFHDQRRAYSFATNALGVQIDALFTEGQGYDASFDTVWDSRGKITDKGYVVWMSIPFRSLRFPFSGGTWGIIFRRSILRANENDYWPAVSSRIDGTLNQEATMPGLQQISPGRNVQLIPYGVLRSFRALDQRDSSRPAFVHDPAEARIGIDGKLVVKDRLAFDLTVNPDFSQVESDDPQTTVNQRFEVFFPEKRPFFLENSNFFQTPITLVFTRRIADPEFGARVTGKLGRYAIGALIADDRSPGLSVPDNDPNARRRARFGIVRVNRDVGKGSTVGMIYTDREFAGGFNRVGGADLHFKSGKNWFGDAQAVTSSTKFIDGTSQAGPAYDVFVMRNGRKLLFNSLFLDNSPGFLTQTGFFQRPDIRRFSNFGRYRFRPEGRHLISHGPSMFQLNLWAHDGTPLQDLVNVNYVFEFKRQTQFGVFVNTGHERLRPTEFSALTANQNYPENHHGVFWFTSFFPQVTASGEAGVGRAINFGPATGAPVPAKDAYITSALAVRPVRQLSIENTYLLARQEVVSTSGGIFTDHIIRSKWNYQISRELSVRFIGQYHTTVANPQLSSLASIKNFNADFLVTYLVHPGTGLYVGYNSNLQNLDPSLTVINSTLLRTRSHFINDGRQFFVKVSYLFRF